jgi:uncharacterized membrane protein
VKTNLLPFLLLALPCAGYLLFVAGSAPLLPERVAMHFNAGGQADNWMSRSHIVIFWETLGVVMPVFFMVSALLTGWIPARFVNLPHREHWLAPERKTQTVAYISRQMIWMGCLAILFLAGIYYLTILANCLTPAQLPMNLLLPLLGGFLAGVLIWSIRFIRHFSKVQ